MVDRKVDFPKIQGVNFNLGGASSRKVGQNNDKINQPLLHFANNGTNELDLLQGQDFPLLGGPDDVKDDNTPQDVDSENNPGGVNPQGEGTTVEKKIDKNGKEYELTSYYDASGFLVKKVIKYEDKTITTESTNDDNGKPINQKTTIQNAKGDVLKTITVKNEYNDDGKIIKQESETVEKMYANGQPVMINGQPAVKKQTQVIENEYNSEGKIVKKTTEQKQLSQTKKIVSTFNSDEKVVHQDITETKPQVIRDANGKISISKKESSSSIDFEYHNNKLVSKKIVQTTDSVGKSSEIIYHYDESGKLTSAERTYYRCGTKVEEKYEGENLKNRMGHIPSERIEYEADGKTVKRKIVNNVDSDGILQSQKVYDKDGNELSFHDFSEMDGKFDVSYQGGTGDCYLLASINALASTDAGAKLLEDNIEVKTDENGKKVYTIKFPGAQAARQALLEGTADPKLGKLDADKVHIQGEYTITEDELKEAAKKAGKKYSVGDKDVLLMEIAYEKYRNDVAQTLKDNNLKSINGAGLSLPRMENDSLSYGTTQEAIFVLTGNTSSVYRNKDKTPTCYIDSDLNIHLADENGDLEGFEGVKASVQVAHGSSSDKVRDEIIQNLIEDCKDGKLDHYAATVGMNVSTQEVNGQVIQGGGHAFTILNITDDKVTLVNPWDSSKPIEMSMENFKKAITVLQCIPVDDEGRTVAVTPDSRTDDGAAPTTPTTPTTPGDPSTTNSPNYTVPRGITYTNMIVEQLRKQGIEPTTENIKKAKEQFEQANPGAVKTYRGKRKAWYGNKYLLMNAKVYIPEFKMD